MKTIPLTKGYEALVDDADYDWLSYWSWRAVGKGRLIYAVCWSYGSAKNRTVLLMHRLILGLPKQSPEVDHEDGNGLNNQRYNLRQATTSKNQANQKRHGDNTSGFKGVCWHPRNKKWWARLMVSGKRLHLGFFTTPQAAHAAYLVAAQKHFGQFARGA